MQQITVTVGRGAGAAQQPLTDVEWNAFRRVIQARLVADGWDLVVENSGTGSWDDQLEENHVFVGIRETTPGLEEQLQLQHYLATTGHRYGQQSIALGYGTSQLVDCTAVAS